MQKSKIAAIYPLGFMQQALLLHSLQVADDQGFILVKCKLKGDLDQDLFKQAWQLTAQRHEVLRSSIHWENIEKSVQVVHLKTDLNIDFQDFSVLIEPNKTQALKDLIQKINHQKINLSKPPAGHLTVVKLSEESNQLFWACHHILLDGWSTAIILRDVFSYYEALVTQKVAKLNSLPSYKTYLSWIKKQNLSRAQKFWTEALDQLPSPNLIASDAIKNTGADDSYRLLEYNLSNDQHQKLKKTASLYKVSLNTIIQGIWSIILSQLFDSQDVVFGTTVSGRSADFPQAELMTGMFMNVLPVRVKFEDTKSIADWLKEVQAYQATMLSYEFVTLEQILSWNKQSGHASIFDTLLIFENFPLDNIKGGGLELADFKSSLTTTYPLSLAVKPDNGIVFQFKYNTAVVTEFTAKWLQTQLESILENFLSSSIKNTLGDFRLKEPQKRPEIQKKSLQPNLQINKSLENQYVGPRNPIELKLTAIWERIFEKRPISVHDNFYAIGGKSLLAVRLFSEIKSQMKRNLPPITILKHPTIASIAQLIDKENEDKPWSSLVPLRTTGDNIPIYCLHGGGSHVFFYQNLAKRLGANQPVYALQSINADQSQNPHESIEEMAAHYLEEIFKVQPKGPYALLGYCFSNAICLEMAKRIQAKGEEVALLAIIDSGPSYYVERTNKDKLSRFNRLLKKGDLKEVFKKLEWKLIRPVLGSHSPWAPKGWQPDHKMPTSLSAKIAKKYNWKPYQGKITLIRSAAFHENTEKDDTISTWKSLAKGGLEVYVIPGEHNTIFKEPHVQGLAKQLAECLEMVTQNA